jgi:hypothetical protein
VEERVVWIAPTGDSLSKGLLTIDFPALGDDSCHIKLSRSAGKIYAYAASRASGSLLIATMATSEL